jgi:N-acetylmuramoyl-L-alanine amidase
VTPAIRDLPSPNQDDRPAGAPIDMLILHYTGMQSGQAAVERLRDPAAKVSSHYVVDEDGFVLRLVAEERRAFHAGVSYWRGHSELNGRSIGIEIVNPGHDGGLPPFPQVQIEATIALCRDIISRRGISPERILAHSDIAPTRKRDPGELFPWAALARAGVGHWVEPAPIGAAATFGRAQQGPHIRPLQALLALYGYGVEITGVYDRATEIVVTAFQRHFRPGKVDGQPDESTIATLRALIDGLGR